MAGETGSKKRFRVPLAAALAVMLATGGGIALLIWAKLRLVTGVPRTVYADPDAEKPATDLADDEPGTISPPRAAEGR